jgi:hypothetical protein
VALADGAANDLPALAALRDLVQPPDGMMAIELDDGRRVLAPVGSNPAAVKRLCGNDELREADRSAVQKHAMQDIVARFK